MCLHVILWTPHPLATGRKLINCLACGIGNKTLCWSVPPISLHVEWDGLADAP